MNEFEKFEVGDLVFANEDHPYLGVEEALPGLVVEVIEDAYGAQVEVGVEFSPDHNEVRFAPEELTIVGREGMLATMDTVKEGDRIMMINPDGELVKVLVEDVLHRDDIADIYGSDADDLDASVSFELPLDTDIFKVSA